MSAFRSRDWHRAFEIAWEEFQDMHALFATSRPPFGYMTPDSLRVLDVARSQWSDEKDGPLVTMDAGANVHFLFRSDQRDSLRRLSSRLTATGVRLISNEGVNDIEGV